MEQSRGDFGSDRNGPASTNITDLIAGIKQTLSYFNTNRFSDLDVGVTYSYQGQVKIDTNRLQFKHCSKKLLMGSHQ